MFARFRVMTQSLAMQICTTRDLRPSARPYVHLRRWILRCLYFAYNSCKIIIGYFPVMLDSDLSRMTICLWTPKKEPLEVIWEEYVSMLSLIHISEPTSPY